MDTAPPLRIDLFTDVVCPWCFVGHERLERVLASSGRAARITHHPFMLNPNTPPEGEDIPAMLRRKYGVPPETLWARLEAEARKSGLELDLAKQRFSYPTARAHTLIRHAEARGTQDALVLDFYRANFMDARNIHDPAVLVEVAAPHGFSADEVQRLVTDDQELALTHEIAQAAAATGIGGVPFFVFGERIAVAGAQSEAVLAGAIEKAAALQAAAVNENPQPER
jgi:predicted DsbA family dithiol-disulfide isomerase